MRLRTRERELGWEGRKLDYGPEREGGGRIGSYITNERERGWEGRKLDYKRERGG